MKTRFDTRWECLSVKWSSVSLLQTIEFLYLLSAWGASGGWILRRECTATIIISRVFLRNIKRIFVRHFVTLILRLSFDQISSGLKTSCSLKLSLKTQHSCHKLLRQQSSVACIKNWSKLCIWMHLVFMLLLFIMYGVDCLLFGFRRQIKCSVFGFYLYNL